MTEEADFSEQITDGKNKSNVRCQFCNCLMLKAQEGTYNQEEVSAERLNPSDWASNPIVYVSLRPGGCATDDAEAGSNGGQPKQRATERLLAGQGHDDIREHRVLQHGGRQKVSGLRGLRARTCGLP